MTASVNQPSCDAEYYHEPSRGFGFAPGLEETPRSLRTSKENPKVRRLADNSCRRVSDPTAHGLKILVVDDDADTRDLVCTILTRCGSEVKCSESAADAILAFQEWSPDLLLNDIGMPHEDGYGLIQKVGQLKSKHPKQIPALALTAYATD